tara:strand:- start:17236 stop:18582 length:1347 start_codon:yes stop_codon:yes gene_type:complete
MSRFELKLPQMGESVAEATLTSWLKEVGDTIEMDEGIFEIATDKVDSEVPSEVDGVLLEKLFDVDDVIKVGQVVAIIETDSEGEAGIAEDGAVPMEVVERLEDTLESVRASTSPTLGSGDGPDRFYSPLVKNIAKQEGLSRAELDTLAGSGKDGRVTKNDILEYVERKDRPVAETKKETTGPEAVPEAVVPSDKSAKAVPDSLKTMGASQLNNGDEVIPLSRMGKLISQYMTQSLATSAHVQSFVEVDVTNVVNWRNKMKDTFEKREGEKLTFTPIFMEAIAKALKNHPMMNISVDGDTVIKKKHINLGMAAALPDGNLIVPVIKNADQLNLVGMAKAVNDLAFRARNNSLKPDEIKDGTYTVTNVGTFGSVFGTPIINQPQVGILALGAIRKLPSVIETEEGDFIGIRSKMFLSHSYDHRVVNGALGGMFVKAVADYLEAWDINREL